MHRGGGSYIGLAQHSGNGRIPRFSDDRLTTRIFLDHAATTPVLPEARGGDGARL